MLSIRNWKQHTQKMMVKGNEEMITFWEKIDNVYGVFLLSFFLLLCHVYCIYLCERTWPNELELDLLIITSSAHILKIGVLSNASSFKVAAVLLNPPAFPWKKKKELFLVFRGSLGPLLGWERLPEQETPPAEQENRKTRREDEEWQH